MDVFKPDPVTGKVHVLLSQEMFGIVRSLKAFRLTGSRKDFIVVGSDSGRIAILTYNPVKNQLERVHMETFGKSGCRRIIPGQYCAVDPKGRAVMLAATEKQKLVYILNRDASAKITISSPLEAHKAHTLVFDICGLDVGFENPVFACLELDYEDADADETGEAAQEAQQCLTYYELDLGLNHVVRKHSEPLDEPGTGLMLVPGGTDGPGGVLLLCENYIIYKNVGDQPDIRCPIPRRRNDLDDPDRGMIIVAAAMHKTKTMFFFFAQNEQGDLFKILLETEEELVTEIKIKYFDTVPVASSLSVLRTGFLFVAGEFGNHFLYQITKLGDSDDEQEFSSAIPLAEGETFFYGPRELKNLVMVDQMDSLAPIMSCHIADLAHEDTPQLYVACGRGPSSTIRVLRHGLEVSEMAVSDLPGTPNAVWTVKKRKTDQYDQYIIVSFVNATLVLMVGETVEEVTDSGFLGTTPTLNCQLMADDAMVQIYPAGIRYIKADGRVNEWKAPNKRQITCSAINTRQICIALSGGVLVYFEMDQTGQLNEYTDRKEMRADVMSMHIGPVPQGKQRNPFLAVALSDQTVRVISLDPSDCLQPRTMQALPALPESVCIVEFSFSGEEADEKKRLTPEQQLALGGLTTIELHVDLILHIGLQNGVLLRATLDPTTGEITDTRTRYLGPRAVKLHRVQIAGKNACLAISSRSWLAYPYQSRLHLTPLSYDALDFAAGFSSEQCPEGIVAIATNTLRILALEKLGAVFNQQSLQLELTPRKFLIDHMSNNLMIIESDHNVFTDFTKLQRKTQMAQEMVSQAPAEDQQLAQEMAQQFVDEQLPEAAYGAPKAGVGMWSSIIRIVNAQSGTALQRIPLEQNMHACSIAMCRFPYSGNAGADDWFVLVGVVKNLQLAPRANDGGEIRTYKLVNNRTQLELLHITPVEEQPAAMAAFHGRVVVGVGRLLRVYDLGKRKLLKKCENKHLPSFIVDIKTQGHRIMVGDIQESIFWVRYRKNENQLVVFADDSQSRWVTTQCPLDWNTVAVGDKFGNIVIQRLFKDASDDVQDDPSGQKAIWSRGHLNGASQKTDKIASFHVGEMVTSIQKATMVSGASEALIYTTLSGSIGMLVPFTGMSDYQFFQQLEMHMRIEGPPLLGRDHIHFRSYYEPIKGVIDGDLCEQFNQLDKQKQREISEAYGVDDNGRAELAPVQISKRLEDIRTRYAF